MAKEQPATVSKPPPKLPRLSKNQRIQKRPLLHPAIASPHRAATTPKIVYISSTSSFIATVKRVRKLLSHIEVRSSSSNGPVNFRDHPNKVLKQLEDRIGKGKGREEEVILKATGKAIEKCLRLATWWMEQGDVKVVVRTRSVGAVDDVVTVEDGTEEEEGSRVRRTSCLEVGISLR